MNNQKFEQLLLDYVEGLLPEDQAQEIRDFAASSPKHKEQLAVLEEGMQFALHLTIHEPSASLDQKILAMARQAQSIPAQPPEVEEEPTSWLERLFAMPSFKPVLAFCTIILVVGTVFITQNMKNLTQSPLQDSPEKIPAVPAQPAAPKGDTAARGANPTAQKQATQAPSPQAGGKVASVISQSKAKKVPRTDQAPPNMVMGMSPKAGTKAEPDARPAPPVVKPPSPTDRPTPKIAKRAPVQAPIAKKARRRRYRRNRRIRRHRRVRSRYYAKRRRKKRYRRKLLNQRPTLQRPSKERERPTAMDDDAGTAVRNVWKKNERKQSHQPKAAGSREEGIKKRKDSRTARKPAREPQSFGTRDGSGRMRGYGSGSSSGGLNRQKEYGTQSSGHRYARPPGRYAPAPPPAAPPTASDAASRKAQDKPSDWKAAPRRPAPPLRSRARVRGPLMAVPKTPTGGRLQKRYERPGRSSQSSAPSQQAGRSIHIPRLEQRQSPLRRRRLLSFNTLMRRGKRYQSLFENNGKNRYFHQALADYRRSLRLARSQGRNPDVRRAALSIVRLYLRAGDPKRADVYVQEYIRTFSSGQRAQAYAQIARLYTNAGYPRRARQYQQAANNSTSPKAAQPAER